MTMLLTSCDNNQIIASTQILSMKMLESRYFFVFFREQPIFNKIQFELSEKGCYYNCNTNPDLFVQLHIPFNSFDRTMNRWEPSILCQQTSPKWRGKFNVTKRAPTCKEVGSKQMFSCNTAKSGFVIKVMSKLLKLIQQLFFFWAIFHLSLYSENHCNFLK